MRAAVLGAGVMGRNIARVLARGGAEVVMFSRSAETLRSAQEALQADAQQSRGVRDRVCGDAVGGATWCWSRSPSRSLSSSGC